ncbi:hypothetical protein [Alkaliphilus peptidifermentans]|uniref:Uncharacterized protein n=1 Tax=Alkaliphilus peptidifermentans DSM 18978 TaxID=1120976 RepID=A0A1G5DRH8_9FIRM|nr:hypothetical protein [Alkaliphilus peptidifermentans]SCY17060.1 hypothetical protein SAMN03080606_00984 [Alkaliphilus peptidifermentans DSM 18978]
MDIEGIKNVRYDAGFVDVLLKVRINSNDANRWELTDPVVQAVYRKDGNNQLDYMELIDNGMAVHGYDFTEEEQNKIFSYIEKKCIAII